MIVNMNVSASNAHDRTWTGQDMNNTEINMQNTKDQNLAYLLLLFQTTMHTGSTE